MRWGLNLQKYYKINEIYFFHYVMGGSQEDTLTQYLNF